MDLWLQRGCSMRHQHWSIRPKTVDEFWILMSIFLPVCPWGCTLIAKVTGVFLSAKAAAEEMIRTKSEGSIILIASMSAYIANRGLDCVAYNASKAGVLQMGRNLACEWGKYKIRVNVFPLVVPGRLTLDDITGIY